MSGLLRVCSYLDDNDVRYEVHEHPTAYTAQALARADGVTDGSVAKVVVVFAGESMLMLVLPGSHHVNLARLAVCLGGMPVRIADEAEFIPRFPDCEPGAMPPFGHLYGMAVVVDAALAAQREIVLQAGTHRHTVTLDYEDFQRLIHPTVAAFADAPASAAS